VGGPKTRVCGEAFRAPAMSAVVPARSRAGFRPNSLTSRAPVTSSKQSRRASAASRSPPIRTERKQSPWVVAIGARQAHGERSRRNMRAARRFEAGYRSSGADRKSTQ